MENQKVWSALLRVKECDIRGNLFIQCGEAADRGIHIGGAESAVAPLTALYFGGSFRCDTREPASDQQDIFLLSKGHAVATLASIYVEKGLIPKEALKNSRGWDALVKGHPGPSMPGVPVSTGPLGQGISMACGYAMRQRESAGFDTYCMVGDGELQEGSCWEGIMFAGAQRLGNLCVLVDKNNGQSDDTHKLVLEPGDLAARFEAFGFRVLEADSGNMDSLLECLREFKRYPRCTRPTAILCESFKGFGGYAMATGKHKTEFSPEDIALELALLERTRKARVDFLNHFSLDVTLDLAEKMGYSVRQDTLGRITGLEAKEPEVAVRRASVRDKALVYDPDKLPCIEKGRAYGATEIAMGFARAFAASPEFYTIDADLSNVSGLYTGTALTNRTHAINAGVAECNMMCMAEGLAAQGAHVWVSTFGPFFNWQAFRRIAISYQERDEAMKASGGWLSEGHNLDITFLSTASNLDPGVNGATHMSNDDICFFSQLAHVKVIDTCCPRQFLAAAQWIAEGNKGLVYLRVMRYPSPALYDVDYTFAYGKGTYLRRAAQARAVIVSSGHGVLEALAAAELLDTEGIPASVVDMPSYDGALLRREAADGKVLLFAEQNNGALFDRFSRDLLENRFACDMGNVARLNTRDREGNLRFIQSGTYEQLIRALGLTARDIADKAKAACAFGEGK